MTPDGGGPMRAEEIVRHSFRPDRATYYRDHAWMAALAIAAGMAALWALGNPHVWTGAVGGLAAVALRCFYLASEELDARWDLTDRGLLGPGGRNVPLARITALRGLGSAVQIVTEGGDKHLLKYQRDRAATRARIAAAMQGTPA
ncbi:hypothetical protein D6850_01515 [Roseovarius spongiae]|uniref:PH domain-containing protein n=1 Tax=Roseovarius spongiae TaxID=2320272 RepID=A0A3A8AY27_9RHOB|nr:hypothetical protein [Roseovarius spongiae]RKF16269.1 hypothetical protein D6850_01515 [Roseovarius spongiae]